MNQIFFQKGGFSQKRLNLRFCGLYFWIPLVSGNPMMLPTKIRIFASNFINLLRRGREAVVFFLPENTLYASTIKTTVFQDYCSNDMLYKTQFSR